MPEHGFELASRIMNEVLARHPDTPESWCLTPAYLRNLEKVKLATEKAETMILSIFSGNMSDVRAGFLLLRMLIGMEIRLCIRDMNHRADGGCEKGCDVPCFMGLMSLKPLVVTCINGIMESIIRDRPIPDW